MTQQSSKISYQHVLHCTVWVLTKTLSRIGTNTMDRNVRIIAYMTCVVTRTIDKYWSVYSHKVFKTDYSMVADMEEERDPIMGVRGWSWILDHKYKHFGMLNSRWQSKHKCPICIESRVMFYNIQFVIAKIVQVFSCWDWRGEFSFVYCKTLLDYCVLAGHVWSIYVVSGQ